MEEGNKVARETSQRKKNRPMERKGVRNMTTSKEIKIKVNTSDFDRANEKINLLKKALQEVNSLARELTSCISELHLKIEVES